MNRRLIKIWLIKIPFFLCIWCVPKKLLTALYIIIYYYALIYLHNTSLILMTLLLICIGCLYSVNYYIFKVKNKQTWNTHIFIKQHQCIYILPKQLLNLPEHAWHKKQKLHLKFDNMIWHYSTKILLTTTLLD